MELVASRAYKWNTEKNNVLMDPELIFELLQKLVKRFKIVVKLLVKSVYC